jgi:hypothetical protein
MSRHTPDRAQQLAHRGDHHDLAGFARGPKAFMVLAQSRVAADGVENRHSERLAQASVAERDCGLPEKTRFLPDLPQ